MLTSGSTRSPAGASSRPRAASRPSGSARRPSTTHSRPCVLARSWSRPSGPSTASWSASGCRPSATSARQRSRTTAPTSVPGCFQRLARSRSSSSPQPSSTPSTRRCLPTAGSGIARGWRPRLSRTSTPSSTVPSGTPCAGATWPATSPTRSTRRRVYQPNGRCGRPSSCARSSPMWVRIASTRPGCSWRPPGYAAPNSPGCAGWTSTSKPAGSRPAARGWWSTTPSSSPTPRRPRAGGRWRLTR
jgi:hypothetical protein